MEKVTEPRRAQVYGVEARRVSYIGARRISDT